MRQLPVVAYIALHAIDYAADDIIYPEKDDLASENDNIDEWD